jgi:hypothetical protein
MLFSLKYLGMTLVERPKGEELSAAAVKRIVATVRTWSGRNRGPGGPSFPPCYLNSCVYAWPCPCVLLMTLGGGETLDLWGQGQ